ncbi:MAG: helix-turn-helix domain-containing protein, partial [Chloroflexota bacterium]
IPALAERREDIQLLVRTFLAALPEATRPTGLSGACQALLFSAHYPGNVRQLKNLVDRAAHLAPRRQIEVADLLLTPAELAALTAPPAAAASAQAAPASAPARKRKSDREALLEALEANDWNLTHAARALDVALNTLKTRMQKFDIPRKKP